LPLARRRSRVRPRPAPSGCGATLARSFDTGPAVPEGDPVRVGASGRLGLRIRYRDGGQVWSSDEVELRVE